MTSNCIFCGRVVSAQAQGFVRVQRDSTFLAHARTLRAPLREVPETDFAAADGC
jgi:hypothetical protein